MRWLGIVLIGVCALAAVGCGGSSKTVTETVEVSTTVTEEPAAGSSQPLSAVTEWCSSPEGSELAALQTEVGEAGEAGDYETGGVVPIEEMIAISAHAPPGAQCANSALEIVKGWALEGHADLVRAINDVEQSAELTLADVRRVEREGQGNGQ